MVVQGKYGIVDDVWMAARVGNKAKVLRTHPVSSLTPRSPFISCREYPASHNIVYILVQTLFLFHSQHVPLRAAKPEPRH